MTDNKYLSAFKRMLTMTLALVMVLGSMIPLLTQEASAFSGKKGSKYTVHWYKELHYGPGNGGYPGMTQLQNWMSVSGRLTIAGCRGASHLQSSRAGDSLSS